MSTPHHRIHRLAATGGAVVALAAALPVGASAMEPNPDQRVAPPAVTAVQPNPDHRDYGGGRVLPHTNWVTPAGSAGSAGGGALGATVYDYGSDAGPAPRPKASGGTDVLVPAGFAAVVLLVGLTGAGVRRRRGAKVAA
jgi:hypothetical protein